MTIAALTELKICRTLMKR